MKERWKKKKKVRRKKDRKKERKKERKKIDENILICLLDLSGLFFQLPNIDSNQNCVAHLLQ